MNERELLNRYELRVLRIVAKGHLPKPISGVDQAERRRLRRHYHDFLQSSTKSELVSALLPYMNSNAEGVLEDTAAWVELHPEKVRVSRGSTDARRRARSKYHKNVESPRRKAVRAWMRGHPEVVNSLKEAPKTPKPQPRRFGEGSNEDR